MLCRKLFLINAQSSHFSICMLSSYSIQKTEALWIGVMRFQRRKIAAYQNISWPSHKVKALGVWLSTIKEESITLNYEEKKETISKTTENWQFRRLTLLGKVVVIVTSSMF